MQDDPGYLIKPYRGSFAWEGIVFLLGFIAIMTNPWTGWWINVLLLILLTVGCVLGEKLRNRCPNCAAILTSRRVLLDSKHGDERLYYDCPHCRITWDPDRIISSS